MYRISKLMRRIILHSSRLIILDNSRKRKLVIFKRKLVVVILFVLWSLVRSNARHTHTYTDVEIRLIRRIARTRAIFARGETIHELDTIPSQTHFPTGNIITIATRDAWPPFLRLHSHGTTIAGPVRLAGQLAGSKIKRTIDACLPLVYFPPSLLDNRFSFLLLSLFKCVQKKRERRKSSRNVHFATIIVIKKNVDYYSI